MQNIYDHEFSSDAVELQEVRITGEQEHGSQQRDLTIFSIVFEVTPEYLLKVLRRVSESTNGEAGSTTSIRKGPFLLSL